MEITKTLTWTIADGRKIEVVITKEKKLIDKVAYADGYNVNLGKETFETMNLTVNLEGKFFDSSKQAPQIPDQYSSRTILEHIKKTGAHAIIGDKTIIKEETYNQIMTLIAEIDAEIATSETEEEKEVTAQEVEAEKKAIEADEKEAVRAEKLVKSGICPKCGTWCHGDCES